MTDEKIAFFDVDHTIIRCVSAVSFLRICIRRAVIHPMWFLVVPFLYVGYRLFRLKMDILYRFALRFLNGCTQAEIRDVAQTAYLEHMKKKVNRAVLAEIQRLRFQNVRIMIATSAPFDFVVDVAQLCDIPENDIIATQFLYKDGRFLGTLNGEPIFCEQKRQAVADILQKENIPAAQCSFYSDSIHDLPLLVYVGRPVAVCPDIRLRRIAKKNQWQIMGK